MAFLEFLHAHLTGKDPSAIPGVFSLGSDGCLITNGPANRISDFSNLPRPAWHLCDIENFFIGMWTMGISFGRNMLILATRGYPYQCTFCSSPSMWTTRYMMRPVSDVVDEIEFLIEEYRANSIDFADLTAIIKKEWVLEFCREIKKRNLNFTWQLPSGTRSEALDKETVGAMYNAGCRFLVYAPESGSQETLGSIRKKLNLENIESSIRDAVRAGHTVKVNFIIGFPSESRSLMLKTVWANIRMAFLGVTDSNISIFAPYPGSEIFNELRRDGTIKLDDEYFHNLLVQFDFTRQTSVCCHVPSWEIAFYRFAGMGLFYIFSYLLHPKRLWHLVWSLSRLLKKGQGFQANSMFEQRIYEYLKREQLREI